MSWLLYALISATAAALTAILAKVGVEGVPSNLATAIRTIVVTGCFYLAGRSPRESV
jgi:bacterial/archaeal transporter family protein